MAQTFRSSKRPGREAEACRLKTYRDWLAILTSRIQGVGRTVCLRQASQNARRVLVWAIGGAGGITSRFVTMEAAMASSEIPDRCGPATGCTQACPGAKKNF